MEDHRDYRKVKKIYKMKMRFFLLLLTVSTARWAWQHHYCQCSLWCLPKLDMKRKAKLFLISILLIYSRSWGNHSNAGASICLSNLILLQRCLHGTWLAVSHWKKPSARTYDAAGGNTLWKYEQLDQDIHQVWACFKRSFSFIFGLSKLSWNRSIW